MEMFDIKDAIELLSEKKISSVELTKNCLEKISSIDQKLGSMLYVDGKKALEDAKASDERRKSQSVLSDIDGIPVTLKDMILTKDMPTTASSRILEGYIPPYDATVVLKLKQAGAVILGKTNQDEFAMGGSNENSSYKPCFNPWDLTRTPGGSSGGSAASVSAEMCFSSLGTDTGGSIRQPAAYCGAVGLKPTYGRVSRFGIIAFASSLDQVGPISKSVTGTAAILSHISGFDINDSTSRNCSVPVFHKELSRNLKGKKIGVPEEYFCDGIDVAVKKSIFSIIDLLKKSGCEIENISLPHTKYAVPTYYIIATAEASSNLSRYDGIRFGPRVGDEKSLLELYERTRGELFGKEVKRRIALGTHVLSAGYYDAYYLRAQKVRRLFANDFKAAFSKVDLIISPTAPTTAFRIGEKIDDPIAMYLNDVYTISANLAGLPAISVPIGFDEANLPIGAQLTGRPFHEQEILNCAFHIEGELNLNLSPASLKS